MTWSWRRTLPRRCGGPRVRWFEATPSLPSPSPAWRWRQGARVNGRVPQRMEAARTARAAASAAALAPGKPRVQRVCGCPRPRYGNATRKATATSPCCGCLEASPLAPAAFSRCFFPLLFPAAFSRCCLGRGCPGSIKQRPRPPPRARAIMPACPPAPSPGPASARLPPARPHRAPMARADSDAPPRQFPAPPLPGGDGGGASAAAGCSGSAAPPPTWRAPVGLGPRHLA